MLGHTESVQDVDGSLGFPLFTLNCLDRMERSGAITAEMRAAGERFAATFQRAGLDGLKAADIGRIPRGAAGGGDLPIGNERARRVIAAVIAALGGHGALVASCVWHVLGLEWSVRKWAQTARRSNDVESEMHLLRHNGDASDRCCQGDGTGLAGAGQQHQLRYRNAYATVLRQRPRRSRKTVGA